MWLLDDEEEDQFLNNYGNNNNNNNNSNNNNNNNNYNDNYNNSKIPNKSFTTEKTPITPQNDDSMNDEDEESLLNAFDTPKLAKSVPQKPKQCKEKSQKIPN